ncbi:hypothetical protein [Antrihabitans cavernicola]|uniref:Sensor domain-containing protein n=1 Tax=Antrihabitans cavernicola TaxID=2495913 RepID=A0A5A7S5N1_9NOCA|nr:hypothetical protein [Spelaeibacter cavernicola]KAA0021478.1 hypothetical protein FOY51_18160 [Spelaeibacter cavernicola]
MLRPALLIAATLCVVVTSGCSSSTVLGAAYPTSDPYRHRLIDQLDLPVDRFDGWEVVDSSRQPDPRAKTGTMSAVVPADCAPDSALTKKSDAVVYGGTRWTGATGTGPGGERFDASLYASNDAPVSDIVTFVDACRHVSFVTDLGPGTVDINPYTPRDRGEFTDVTGYSTAKPQPQPPGITSTATIVGRSDSMTLVVSFSNPGPLDRDRVDAVWKTATDKFGRTE